MLKWSLINLTQAFKPLNVVIYVKILFYPSGKVSSKGILPSLGLTA